jgi:hypothetical protein
MLGRLCKSDVQPDEANVIMSQWKRMYKILFPEDDLKKINALRFNTTRELKRFNRDHARLMAKLMVIPCAREICGARKIVFYEILVDSIDCSWTVGTITFAYELRPVERRSLSEISIKPDTPYSDTSAVYDIISLALKLMHVFYSNSNSETR